MITVNLTRKARWLVALLWAMSLACDAAAATQTLLVFGDSLSAPYGIAEKRGWVSLLAERLKKERLDYRVVNASISGETTSGGRARHAKVLADHKPAVVILELGGNDGLRGLPVPEMKKNLGAMIEQSQKTGARVLLVGTRMPPNYGPEYTQAYESVFADLAKSHRIALTPDLTAGIGERLELFLPDRVHPNESAQPALLENVWKALRPLLGKTN
jgi:acyl-CoA thioesterase-1